MKKTSENLIPDITNPSPDYYCTWQTQLYATNDGKPVKQRENICEKSLFCKEKPFGWAYFYEKARKDLILVMDDSWDVPLNGDENYYGSLLLNPEKFPSFTGNNIAPEESYKLLADKLREIGWKSLGGWVCAQESSLYPETTEDEYWIKRLKWSEKAGFTYWKVDWGKKAGIFEFRKNLSQLSHKYAPSVVIENAMVKDVIPYSDVYRTYDVQAIMSIPMTMEKLRVFFNSEPPKDGFKGIINCEDEAYMAASLGCTMGIMRHPYVGSLPNGKPDPSCPDLHRRIKTKIAEVTRAVRWHRIAPAFGVDKYNTYFSEQTLTDSWHFKDMDAEIEGWWFKTDMINSCFKDGVLTKQGMAAISRNISLPKVIPDGKGDIPYVTASKNPNGVISIATCGRTRERQYWIPLCSIEINGGMADTFGIFGEYKELIINFDKERSVNKILAEDLAGDYAYDITDKVKFTGNKVIISGDIIHNIGTSEQEIDDTSEPGMVLKFM